MDVLNTLKNKKIISQTDIENFKIYIYQKYEALEEEKREAILWNSISYVVKRDLSHLELPVHDSITHHFVEEILLNKKQDLFADEVFEALISSHEPSQHFFTSLTKWVNQHMDEPLHEDVLESYYGKNQEEEAVAPNPKAIPWVLSSFIILMLAFPLINSPSTTINNSINPIVSFEEEVLPLPSYVTLRFQNPNRNFPHYFFYRDIDEGNLKGYLKKRNSLLMDEPYFTYIVSTAKAFDLNPLLLFAIAGHEQAFIPKDHPNSDVMINNPFNVFGSWQAYNTTLEETAAITARTIYNSLGDLPPHVDPFYWLNRRYAEDPNWWQGVRAIFSMLERNY
ncbi:glucosaminidase domain-containing protein [Natronincola ferrireducens]|uniref:Putative ABC transport system permease protein n=1 Tax=Natronincola ferrireducens TaxID=393762 RepID=A0A1G9FTX2_9FIRM|nr:glucosaminidase domain-containing protein [Natronincola ferrireducens]SDK91830.1 putative ABC transport system permease protein [Natronincola ferrireducens]